MFVLKFVPTIYDEPALHVLIGYHNKSANQIAHGKIIVNRVSLLIKGRAFKHWSKIAFVLASILKYGDYIYSRDSLTYFVNTYVNQLFN